MVVRWCGRGRGVATKWLVPQGDYTNDAAAAQAESRGLRERGAASLGSAGPIEIGVGLRQVSC